MSSASPERNTGQGDAANTCQSSEGETLTGIGIVEVRARRVVKQIDPTTGEPYGYQDAIIEIFPPKIIIEKPEAQELKLDNPSFIQ